MKLAARIAGAVVVALAIAAGGSLIERAARADDTPAIGPGLARVDVDVRYSEFSVSELKVKRGSVIEFRVRNDDPIHHEFIVGDPSVHARHRDGTESRHPPIPGEVSVGPNDVGATFFRFDRPGRYEFACHLPGHYEYGMKGVVVVE